MFRHLESIFRYLERLGGLILFFTLVLEGHKVVLWLWKKCFFHLSYLDYNMFLICSQGSLSFLSFVIWLVLSSVRASTLCEGHLPWCSGRDYPEGSTRWESWDSLSCCWAETILELIQAGPIWPRDWGHVLEGVNAVPSLKSSGRIILLWPFSLGFQWKFNTKKKKALIFISTLFHWYKSMQVLEGHLSTETLPVYQPHIRDNGSYIGDMVTLS